jgi:hypothetical protein
LDAKVASDPVAPSRFLRPLSNGRGLSLLVLPDRRSYDRTCPCGLLRCLLEPTACCLARHRTAGRRACEIRLRAERKAGDLLRDTEKAKGGRPEICQKCRVNAARFKYCGYPPGICPQKTGQTTRPVSGNPTLNDLGISKQQSSDWQKLAGVPQEQFEGALCSAERKSGQYPRQEPGPTGYPGRCANPETARYFKHRTALGPNGESRRCCLSSSAPAAS